MIRLDRTVIYYLCAIVLGCVQSHAERISEQQACAVAQSFFSKKNVEATPQLAMRINSKKNPLKTASQVASLYVFNSGNTDHGWVVVAGDDRVRPVLAYSDEGVFDASCMPPAMQEMLEDYANQIENLTNESTTYNAPAIDGYSIYPLLTTKWGQSWPYNLSCPKFDGQNAVTGCVATALAQVMFFHRHANMTQNIPAYSTEFGNYESLSPTTFNWGAMRNTYSEDDTSITPTSKYAVATLMKYCGYAMQMIYGKDASAAFVSPNGIARYFGYDPSVTLKARVDHSRQQWHQMIFNELSQRRPVIMSGDNLATGGGHAFVCDGYDGDGHYHINWGWKGLSDGYFEIDLFTDGPGRSAHSFIAYLQAAIGLKPSTGSSTQDGSNLELSCTQSNYEPNVTIVKGSRSSKQEDYTIKAQAMMFNMTVIDNYFDLGWELSYWGIAPNYYIAKSNNLIKYRQGHGVETTINFGAGTGSGLYILFPVCRLHGTSEWKRVIYSGQNYAIMISTVDNTLNVKHVSTNYLNEILEFEGAELRGIRKVGRILDACITFKSIPTNFPLLYLFVNNELVGMTSLYDEDTNQAHIYFTPETAGTKQMKITTSPEGNNAVYQSSAYISTATPASLSLYTHIPSMVNGVIKSTQAKIFTDVINRNSDTFNDAIYYLIEKQMPDMSYRTLDFREEKISVQGNGMKQFFFFLSNLDNACTYRVTTYYYNEKALVKQGILTFKMDISGACDVNCDKAVNAADVTALYNHILNGNNTFLSSSDVNGDGAVNAADVTAVYNYILGY